MEARTALCVFLVLLSVVWSEGLNPITNGPKLLFVFGDSDVDTGNTLRPIAASWQYPYGKSFPGRPTGRYSDGRVFTDYIAAEVGLPSPIPYRVAQRIPRSRLRYGVNFAYAGAGVFETYTYSPTISHQIDQLEELINDGTYPREQLSSAMVFMSVAGNDYATFIIQNGSIEALDYFTRTVVKQISVELSRVSKLGVGKILVAGVEATGCLPVTTRLFTNYTTCADVNGNALLHNSLLQMAVNNLNADAGRPGHIAVLNVFTAMDTILRGRSPLIAKFENRFKPCCMGLHVSGLLNGDDCSAIDVNGGPLYTICDNPDASFFWDRVHPTQAGWSAIVQFLHADIQKFIISS